MHPCRVKNGVLSMSRVSRLQEVVKADCKSDGDAYRKKAARLRQG